jgi:hypothetical protein
MSKAINTRESANIVWMALATLECFMNVEMAAPKRVHVVVAERLNVANATGANRMDPRCFSISPRYVLKMVNP